MNYTDFFRLFIIAYILYKLLLLKKNNEKYTQKLLYKSNKQYTVVKDKQDYVANFYEEDQNLLEKQKEKAINDAFKYAAKEVAYFRPDDSDNVHYPLKRHFQLHELMGGKCLKNVDVKDVLHMENRLSSNDSSFDAPVQTGNDEEVMSPSQYLEDKRYDPEVIVANEQAEQMNRSELVDALKMLDDRSKDILQRRYLSDQKATLHDLADEYEVSAERIRQIENTALKKLKSLMVDFA